jgi:hypothetical protein
MDMIYEDAGGNIYILDHKTNRSLDKLSYWQENLQPRIYAWAARQMYPGRRIFFQLGYVNFPMAMYTWETHAEDDAELERLLAMYWKEMEYQEKKNQWERTPNVNCRYCAIQTTCGARQTAIATFKESAIDMLTPKPLAERLERAKLIAKLVADEIDNIENAIKTMIGNSESVVDGDYVYSATESQTRFINAVDALPPVIGFIRDADSDDPEDQSMRLKMIADLMTVKVTALDKLKRTDPALYNALAAQVQLKPGAHKIKVDKIAKRENAMLKSLEVQ